MSNEKMTIEVNMGNLSEDERAQFKLLIEKANTPPQKKMDLSCLWNTSRKRYKCSNKYSQ